MREKQLHKTLHKRGNAIADLTSRIGSEFDMDTIHEFRTTLKKWRALLRAFSVSKQPLTRSFKKLVHISGDLRNSQVLLADKTMDDERLEEFKKWLQALLAEQQNSWRRCFHPRIVKRQLRENVRQDYKKSGKRGIDQFCRKEIHRIQGILCVPSPSHEELHSARKLIKDVEYVSEWAARKYPGGGYAEKLGPLKRIARQAGDFNDRRIALDLLHVYLQEKGPSGLTAGVAAVRQAWDLAVSKKRKTLLNALKRYVHAARP
ncbi:MAG: CHAD domain-containing protein [Bacteroidota bacterium]|nr:CHAD domain-containing protein [Bacteroidota bacterium]MDP4215012.1 CHAD domain-containing protein [Bacteroidota bacterium]MDP4244240.1 CHAD domain-containing protein [Bacteroidota bacterium]MDP4255975.1 CHAD domain-containing protein [Bacteroidota bacterium]MDP4257013.1 CHAD domain-containing protein [Bacteroidota bacterium]